MAIFPWLRSRECRGMSNSPMVPSAALNQDCRRPMVAGGDDWTKSAISRDTGPGFPRLLSRVAIMAVRR
jgi:hypothetical protein